MADEDKDQKTEQPTGRRLEKAREQGDQVKSQEIQTLILLLGGTLAVAVFGRSSAIALTNDFRNFIAMPDQFAVDGNALVELARYIGLGIAGVVGPIIGVLIFAGLTSNFVQNRPSFNPERVKFSFAKLNPLNGIKRIFGVDGISNLAKGMLKIGIVGLAIWLQVWPERNSLEAVLGQTPVQVLGDMGRLAFKLMISALVAVAFIAGADYLLQRHEFFKRNRMTKQEVRDEHKETEGDPKVKARIRQIRYERATRRMMASVPQATVVITNPTHFAVALQYEQGVTPAPICLAKGADAVALRIREVATANNVPIVENPPLARALFASVEIDETIPPEHYQAVAKVIGYVLKLTGKLRQ